MALRAVIDHPKFAHLKHLLGLKKFEALGLLESLWHFTGKYAPQGNVGKYSDVEIEIWLEWGREPGAAVRALVESRWLDRDATHRLIVHDWSRHADDATRKSLGRNKLDFVSPSPECVGTCLDKSGHIQEVSGPPVVRGQLPESFKSFNTVCAEPSKSKVQAPPPLSPVVMEFPIKAPKGKPRTWPLHQDKIAEYQQTFTGMDVKGELRKARQWCNDNPSKQKTAGGMGRFLFAWLERTNNRGHGMNGNGNGRGLGVASTGKSSHVDLRTPEQIEDDDAIAMLKICGDNGTDDVESILPALERLAGRGVAEFEDGRWYLANDPAELKF